MKSGDIVLTFMPTYLWKEQQTKGYPLKPTFKVKEGIYTTPACAAIPKGHPGPQELAELFINRALSAEAQVGMAQGLWYGPTNRKVKFDDPAITANLVMPENFKSVVPVDVPLLSAGSIGAPDGRGRNLVDGRPTEMKLPSNRAPHRDGREASCLRQSSSAPARGRER